MKRTVLALVALLVGLVPAKSQTAPGQPAPSASNTVQRATKLTIAHPWEDVTIRLIIPASLLAPGKTVSLQARKAHFQDPELPRGGLFPVVAAEDTLADRTFIIEGVFDYGVFNSCFYLSRASGVTAFFVGSTGTLSWKHSFLEVAGTGRLQEAILRFEAEFDSMKLGPRLPGLRPSVQKRDAQGRAYWKSVPDANWVHLRPAAPDDFFQGASPGDGKPLFLLIENIETTDNILPREFLRLDLRNPARQKAASFWIDLEARKVIRCVADARNAPKPAFEAPPRWSDDPLGRKSVLIRVVIPASAHEEGRTELVKAWRGFLLGRLEPVLVAEDPRSGQPFLSLAVNEGVYVLRPSGVTAVSIHAGGGLVWRESYVEMADSGKLEAALKRIEKTWFNGVVDEAMLRFRDAHRINLASAAPRDFFLGPETRASFYSPVIEKAEMTNNTLRLEIRNPITQKVASFWIDLEARKVIKCVADGKELGLSIDRSGFDVPPEKELKPAQRGK